MREKGGILLWYMLGIQTNKDAATEVVSNMFVVVAVAVESLCAFGVTTLYGYVYSWHSGKLKQALFFHVNIPVEGYFFKLTKNVAITVSGAFNNLYTVSCNALCSFTLNTLFVQTSQQSRHPCHNRIPNQQDFPPKPAVLRPVRIRSYLFLTPCALRLHSLQPQVESTT